MLQVTLEALVDKQYEEGLETHLNALKHHGCQAGRDGDRVWVTTPAGQTYRSEDFTTAQGKEWGAIRAAMKDVGLTAEDVLTSENTPS